MGEKDHWWDCSKLVWRTFNTHGLLVLSSFVHNKQFMIMRALHLQPCNWPIHCSETSGPISLIGYWREGTGCNYEKKDRCLSLHITWKDDNKVKRFFDARKSELTNEILWLIAELAKTNFLWGLSNCFLLFLNTVDLNGLFLYQAGAC